jgi:hypothetical protein
MKCLYFLASNLATTREISEDLHEVGIKDFYLHVIARDEAGLKQEHIHSSNYFETLDLVREGVLGGLIGFVAGLIGAFLLMQFNPFGVEIATIVYVAIVGLATLFGTWVGGLTGIDTENRKLARFHDDIEGGKFLLLVYVRKEQEAAVSRMMAERHPDAELVAVDRHFINPFSSPKRMDETVLPRA